jgi:hypothetical protein
MNIWPIFEFWDFGRIMAIEPMQRTDQKFRTVQLTTRYQLN